MWRRNGRSPASLYTRHCGKDCGSPRASRRSRTSMAVRRARTVFERWDMASSPYDRRERTRARTTFTRISGVFAQGWADNTMITLRAREAFRALCAICWFVRPQRVKCTPRYLTSFDAKMLFPFTLMCTSVFWEVLVWNGTNTVFWEERANPFTCIKWTTPSTASWNSFMLRFTHELFVWRRLMWVSVHIARWSAYMVSTTFPFTAVSTSWTVMSNNRGRSQIPEERPYFGVWGTERAFLRDLWSLPWEIIYLSLHCRHQRLLH